MKIDKMVIVRGIMSVIAAINIICGYLGWHLIPVTDAEVGIIVNGVIVFLTAVIWAWGWWKNNSITENAQRADFVLHVLKTGIPADITVSRDGAENEKV